MGTIVCAVDDSPEAKQALETAARLSRDSGLRLVLVNVEAHELTPGVERCGQSLLDRLVAEEGLTDHADKRVEAGDPAGEVARVAAEEAASVIVIGSRRRRWLGRTLKRGLAADLNATAECPVVVVPAPPRR